MNIIQDTREKNGWDFIFSDDEITRAGLKCGDYTTDKLEDLVRIERKASSGELYGNLSAQKAKDRFYRELEKLEMFEFAYIICEFPESRIYEFPRNSGIPRTTQKYIKIGSKYFRKLIHNITKDFNVEILFFDDRDEAEQFTHSLFHCLESSLLE